MKMLILFILDLLCKKNCIWCINLYCIYISRPNDYDKYYDIFEYIIFLDYVCHSM